MTADAPDDRAHLPADAPPAVDRETREADARRFRRNLLRVMTVQVVTLVLLWLLQRAYTP